MIEKINELESRLKELQDCINFGRDGVDALIVLTEKIAVLERKTEYLCTQINILKVEDRKARNQLFWMVVSLFVTMVGNILLKHLNDVPIVKSYFGL